MYNPIGPYFVLENFLNDYTINIFCDASIQNGKPTNGCYGAIAYLNGKEIDSECKVCTDTTNNNSEIKALRLGVCLALKFKLSGIPVINIFSDSQISVFGIRDRIYNWRMNRQGKLIGSNKTEIANQDIFIEIMRMMVDNEMNNIAFYHQKGHVNTNNNDDLLNAMHVFQASNNVREDIDVRFIKFISDMNNVVDKRTRRILYKQGQPKCTDPVTFYTTDFNNYIGRYYEQNKYKRFNEGSK